MNSQQGRAGDFISFPDLDGSNCLTNCHKCCGNTNEEDVSDISNWLRSLGASDYDVQKGERVVLGTNNGLTFSNDELKMSLVCISNATSEEQWWNTVVHELYHIQHTICSYYEIEAGSEDCAYLQGELMRLVVSGLKKMR